MLKSKDFLNNIYYSLLAFSAIITYTLFYSLYLPFFYYKIIRAGYSPYTKSLKYDILLYLSTSLIFFLYTNFLLTICLLILIPILINKYALDDIKIVVKLITDL